MNIIQILCQSFNAAMIGVAPRRRATPIIAALLFTLPALAQNPIQTTLNVNPPYSTLVSDYITNFNRAITLQLVNTGNTPLDVRLSGTLRGSSGVTVFLPDDLGSFIRNGGQGITVGARQTKLFRAVDIETMFPTDYTVNNSSANLRPALISNLVLPEGDYELCVKVFDATSNRQLADVACAYFTISNIEPPYLLSPQDKDPMPTATATYQPVQFQWTYPAGATPTKIEYVLQVAELRAGQNPYNVFQSGPPFAEIVIPNSNPVYILKPTDPRLEVGRTYAWRVQVRGKGTNAGLVNFQNNGYSTVNTFTYGGPQDNLVSSSDALTGTKKTESTKPVATLTGGNCACEFPDVADKVAVSTLTNAQTVYIGSKENGYQLSISEISGTDKFSGNGTVALSPTFGPTDRKGLFLPLRVEFNDIQVNKDGVLLAGQIQSMKRADNLMGVMPSLATAPGMPAMPGLPDADALTKIAMNGNWTEIKNKISQEAGKLFSQAEQQANQQRNGAGFETPIGYSSDVFTLAVDNIIFTATSAQYDAMTVINALGGTEPIRIPLGVKGACMPSASCQGSTVLYLLKDTSIPYLGLTLRGGLDAANSTYYTYTPNAQTGGTSELTIAADYYLKDATYLNGGESVKADIRARTVKGFDHWNATATIANEFKINGIDDFTFKLNTATFDHDLESNPAGFPAMLASLETDLGGKSVATDKLANLRSNTWKGFFMDKLTVTLPGVFQTASGAKTTMTANNLLIDGHLGLSGSLMAEKVIEYKKGSLDGWFFSLEKVGITFFDGRFIKASADGKIGLPISGNDERSGLTYTNTLTQGEPGEGLKYLFLVKPDKDIEVPIWAAKFTLSETSTIQVTIGKTADNPAGGTWAGADLSGKISINPDYLPSAVRSSGLPTFSLDLMSFEHLKIQSKGPKYIDWGTYKSAIYDDAGKAVKNSPFAGAFASPQKSIMGLPISIDDYGPVMEGTKVGFKFTATMSLSDIPAVPKASATLRIMANIGLKDGRPNWSFDNIYLDSIAVAGTIGPVSVAGNVAFYRKAAVYGDGLYGSLKAKFPLNIEVGADARFGTVNNTSYWYVSAKATGLTVAVGPGVLITGFGGGAFHNMTAPPTPKADQLLAKAPLPYKPQDGMNGFQASVYLSSADGATPGAVGAILKADGTLTVQFDKDWGLDLIEIKANAHLVCNVPGPSDKAIQGMADGTGVISYKVPDEMFNLNVQVKASVVDMVELNAWLAVHVGPDGYYIKLGEPDKRITVKLKAPGLGVDLGEGNAYFVMGTLDMPGSMPDPYGIDPGLLAQVGYHKPAIDFKSGLAFGSALAMGTGANKPQRFLIFYLSLNANIGFDVIMGATKGTCNGVQPGINGYYAMGQIYAGVDFKFGVGVDLWFVSGDFDVASVRAGAIFTGGLPNPTWLRGILYGQYDILDGLVSGNMSFRLKIGDVCLPDTDTNPFKMPLIASVSPATGDKKVSILKNPVVTFNYPVNQDICVSKPINENGDLGTDCYKVEFSLKTKCGDEVVKNTNTACIDCNEEVIPNEQIFFSQRGTEATFYKEKAFSPDRNYTLEVRATAYRKQHGETKFTSFSTTTVTVNFTSGECIKTLSRSGAEKTIAASYPFKDQRFLLQKEYGGQGFIQLTQELCCLQGNGSLIKTVAEFSDAFAGTVLGEAPVAFEGKLLRFDIPKLPNEKVIQVRILQKPTDLAQQQANQPSVLPGLQTASAGNNYVGTTSSGVQFADGKTRDGAAPTASKGTVTASAASSYRLVRDAGTQRLTPVLKPVVLTAYYFRTSRYDTWATKLADRKQDQVTAELVQNPHVAKLEETRVSFDLAEGFDVFDIGRSEERLDVNRPGQIKEEIGYPALLTMQEPSKTVTHEGVSFSMTNNRWFTTHAQPIYQRSVHLQNAANKVGALLRSDLASDYANGRGLLRVSAMNLWVSPKPPLQPGEKPQLVIAPLSASAIKITPTK